MWCLSPQAQLPDLSEQRAKVLRLQAELETSEQVQRDFVRLSQALQVRPVPALPDWLAPLRVTSPGSCKDSPLVKGVLSSSWGWHGPVLSYCSKNPETLVCTLVSRLKPSVQGMVDAQGICGLSPTEVATGSTGHRPCPWGLAGGVEAAFPHQVPSAPLV